MFCNIFFVLSTNLGAFWFLNTLVFAACSKNNPRLLSVIWGCFY